MEPISTPNNIAKINCLPEITSSPQTNYLRNVETEGCTKQIVSTLPVLTGRKGAYLCYRFQRDTHTMPSPWLGETLGGLQCFTYQKNPMKSSSPISPPLRNANIEIQMVCVRAHNSSEKSSKARGSHWEQKEFRRICHLL